ncbi:dna-directed rna polymerase ii iii [Holotrichia oblita]|uniref:Dna-directed rna polymerase ii iii n=1 Tax=Holotrichia oblita TaxID=644536 RepID=A0ACB9TDG5_HOLOL|nr:dna-directed rna polymerase ii iii [Holotrichia oblita]
MNTLLVLAAALAVACASVVPVAPLASTTVVEGPSSSAQVVGPDGSAIVAANPAGRIVASETVGVGAVGYSAPVVPAVAPVVSAYSAPVVSAYSTPVVSAYSAPVVSAYHAPAVARTLVASPLTASGYPLLAAGSGLEGQWIPDINEKLYDDGSYKGEIY